MRGESLAECDALGSRRGQRAVGDRVEQRPEAATARGLKTKFKSIEPRAT